jgi:GT2 family glycosyltransferase
MNDLLITGSIVLYNNDIKIIEKSIHSFLETNLNIYLYLIDNSPTDELKKLKLSSKIEYFHNPSNPGFGAAHNIAIRKSLDKQSDYHVILNPDIYYDCGTLESLVDFMKSNREVGHVMPKILYPNGDFQFLCKTNPTFFDLFARGFLPNLLKKSLKKRLDKYTYANADFGNTIYDIPYLSGCFMMFRSSVLKKVGFFDDNIFMYLEDADITRRFLEISRTAYYSGAIVYHHFAGLTHKKWKYKWITIQSSFVYFNKWGWFKNIY